MIAVVGLLAIAFVLAGNFKAGLDQTHWNDVGDAWVKPDQRASLDALVGYFEGQPRAIERPVVFIADDEAEEPVRIYGFAKLVGNVSRYGVPGNLQDRTSFYLGSLDEYLKLRPTDRDPYYRSLSAASLDDSLSVGPELSMSPLVVVADVFNKTGSNAELFEAGNFEEEGADVIFIADGQVHPSVDGSPPAAASEGIDGIVRTIFGAILLLVPGLLLVRYLLPGASAGETLAMVPVLGVSLLALVTIFQLGISSSPLTSGQAWFSLVVATALSGVAFVASGLGGGVVRNEPYSTVGS
jgi:hypothetical protein